MLRRALPALALLGLAGCDDTVTSVRSDLVVWTGWVADDGETPLIDFGPVTVLDTQDSVLRLEVRGRAEIQVVGFEVRDNPENFSVRYVGQDGKRLLDPVSGKPLEAPFRMNVSGDARFPNRMHMQVRFLPTDRTQYADELVIRYTEGGKSATATVELIGEGSVFGKGQIGPSPLDFGRVGEKQQSIQTILVESLGPGPLVVRTLELRPSAGEDEVPPEITTAGSWETPIVLLPPEDGLPGARVPIYVRCAPTTQTRPGELHPRLRAVVHVETNDPAQRTLDIPVVCTVNRAPIAAIRHDSSRAVGPGQLVEVSGSDSSDPDGDLPLGYSWTLIPPAGSFAELDDPSSVDPTFVPDISGTYTLYLTVTDAAGVPCCPLKNSPFGGCAKIEIDATSPDELEFELSWEHDRTDLDIHVVEILDPTAAPPYFLPKDCYFGTRSTDPADAPNGSRFPGRTRYCGAWGMGGENGRLDDPTMFEDHLRGPGPERVLVGEGLENVPPAGTFEVGVHFKKTNGAPSPTSRAIVRVYVYGKLAAQRDLLLEPGQFWRVFRVTWPEATRIGKGIEVVDEVTGP